MRLKIYHCNLIAALLLMTLFPAMLWGEELSGAVSYNGSQAGRIYIAITGASGAVPVKAGTSIPGPGVFKIRGVPPGEYVLTAFLDANGVSVPVASSPILKRDVSVLAGSTQPEIALALEDPLPIVPPASPAPRAVPGDRCVMVHWDRQLNSAGVEMAEYYNLYWGTSSSAGPGNTPGGGSKTQIPAGSRTPVFINGLVNGQTLYFSVTAVIDGQESQPSPASIPLTVGAPLGGSSVSGVVTYPGLIPAGPLYVVAVSSSGSLYFTKVDAVKGDVTGSRGGFIVQGVSEETYQVYAVLDLNNDGFVDHDDLSNIHTPVVGSPGLATNIQLARNNTASSVRTIHWKDGGEGYLLDFNVNNWSKQPVTAVVSRGPQISIPVDMGIAEEGGLQGVIPVPDAPIPGDSYDLDVTYADNSFEVRTVTVTGVLDFAMPQTPAGSVPYAAQPTFAWAPPSTVPGAFVYGITLSGDAHWAVTGIPPETSSIIFNYDGTAGQSSLVNGGAYSWNVQVLDVNGNSSRSAAQFVMSSPGTISGRIVNEIGAPARAEMVTISAERDPEKFLEMVWPDGQGRFEFKNLSPGKYYLYFSSSEYLSRYYGGSQTYQSAELVVLDSLNKEITMVMLPAGSISGRITDASGVPVTTGYKVTVYGSDMKIVRTANFFTGNYEIGGIPAGVFYVQVDAPGYYSQVYRSTAGGGDQSLVSVGFKEKKTGIDLSLVEIFTELSFEVRGEVGDSAGISVAGATVAAQGLTSRSALSSDSGHFALQGIPVGSNFSLRMSRYGYLPTYTEDFESLGASLDLPTKRYILYKTGETALAGLSPGFGVIRGRVTDSASPAGGVAGVKILAFDFSTGQQLNVVYPGSTTSTTAASGEFSIPNLANGSKARVSAQLNGWDFGGELKFTVRAGAVAQGDFSGLITAEYPTVSGLVLDGGGKPLAGAVITARDSFGKSYAVEYVAGDGVVDQTGVSGMFRITTAPSGTWLVVTVQKSGASYLPQTMYVTTGTNSVTMTPVVIDSKLAVDRQTGIYVLAFEGGANPRDEIVTLTSSGDIPINWAVSITPKDVNGPSVDWLSVSATSGTNSAQLTLSFKINGLTPRFYPAVINIIDPKTSVRLAKVDVNLIVGSSYLGPPELSVTVPRPMVFQAVKGGPDPIGESFEIANAGGGTLAWRVTDKPSWVVVSPESGAGAGAVNVAARVSGLEPGIYAGFVTITAEGVTNSPFRVPVTLRVEETPLIAVSSATLAFRAQAGQGNQLALGIDLSNRGGGVLEWIATSDRQWLTVSPSQGKQDAQGGGRVVVSTDTTGLLPGTYTGNVSLYAVGVNSPPVLVPVTLVVAPVAANGDVNSDGMVDISDAVSVLRMAVGIVSPNAGDLAIGDVGGRFVNGVPAPDGKINMIDALLILKKAAGLQSY